MRTVPTPAGELTCYVAEPQTPGRHPGVVVVHELFGLNDDIRRIADRFAAAGYLAAAPDLLGKGNRIGCVVRLARAMQSGSGPAVEHLAGLRDWLAARDDCTGKVGIAGFCLGGGFALLMANRGFAAASVNYGRLPKALSEALAGSCPMVASYGALDRSLRGAADRLASALAEADVPHDVKEYPQAGHSFLNQATPPPWMFATNRLMHVGYVETAAEDSWARILAMFGEALA